MAPRSKKQVDGDDTVAAKVTTAASTGSTNAPSSSPVASPATTSPAQQTQSTAQQTQSTAAQNASGISALRSWATLRGHEPDPYVAGLLQAVDQRQDLSVWAAMDPMEMLPHSETGVGSRARGLARLLHFSRNLAVFLPIALTWRGIHTAMVSFDEYSRDLPPGTEVNFLQFWQGSVGPGLPDHATIQYIALWDARIIIGIIVLTIVAGMIDARVGKRRKRAQSELEAERVAVAVGVKRALYGKREATAESITESLAESLNDLMNAARMVNTASLRMEAVSVGVESVGPRIETLSARLADVNSRLGTDLQRAIDSLTTAVARLGGTVDGELSNTLNQVLVGLDEIREQLGRTSATVEFGTKNLRDDLDAIHGQLSSVARGTRL